MRRLGHFLEVSLCLLGDASRTKALGDGHGLLEKRLRGRLFPILVEVERRDRRRLRIVKFVPAALELLEARLQMLSRNRPTPSLLPEDSGVGLNERVHERFSEFSEERLALLQIRFRTE